MGGQILQLVDVIPESLALETFADREPSLAVDPSATKVLAVTVMSEIVGTYAADRAAVFVSTNAGESWFLTPAIEAPTDLERGDATIAAGSDHRFFIASLPSSNDTSLTFDALDDLRTGSPKAVEDRQQWGPADQPHIQIFTAVGQPDKICISWNDFSNKVRAGRSATLQLSRNGGRSFGERVALDDGTPEWGNGPPVRVAFGEKGALYAAFQHLSKALERWNEGDVVVVRDPTGFGDLRAMKRWTAVRGRRLPAQEFELGNERVNGCLAIAVGPKEEVYVAWLEALDSRSTLLHVAKSTLDRDSWPDVTTVRNVSSFAVAVARNGTLAVLYQQLTTDAGGDFWSTVLRQVPVTGEPTDTLLVRAPANEPIRQRSPYQGDFVQLVAVESEFRGVFAASNRPVSLHPALRFPRKIGEFSRDKVRTSIDPYYVSAQVLR